MDSTLKIGNGELIVGSTSSASRKLYVTSNSDVARFEQTASDKNMVIELRHTNPNASGTIREEGINFLSPNASTRGRITFYPSDTFNVRNYLAFFTPSGSGTNAERMRIANDGEIYVNGTSDAGDFKMQVYGNQYIQGILGLGTTSPSTELHILSSTGYAEIRLAGASGSGGSIEFYDATTQLGDIYVDPSKNMVFRNQNEAMRLNSSRELLIGTTSDAGAYALQVSGAIYNTTTMTTGAPTSGSAKPWRLGEAATVSPTSPNRTIRVEIDGTVYYIHAKTTND